MERKNKREELALCRLLDMALHAEREGTRKKLPRELKWEQLLAIADGHCVLPLLYDVLWEILPRDEQAWKLVQNKSRQTVQQSYRLLFLSRFIIELLEKEGIAVILLKGSGVSEYYPVPELRKSGDIDLLFEGKEAAQAACRCLQTHGFWLEEEQHANHHFVCGCAQGIRIELHIALAEPFDSKKVNQYLSVCQKKFFAYKVTKTVMEVNIPAAAAPYEAFYLLLHMLQHFLRAGFGLKLLCDWVVFWERGCTKEDKMVFLTLLRESQTFSFAHAVTQLCVRYLGLTQQRVSFLLKYGGYHVFFEEAYLSEFLFEIMDAQEFGTNDAKRMVVMRGIRWQDYVREFHHQMLLNYPKARDCPMFYPFFWMATLVGFCYRNRKIRRISSLAVLKNAKKRSRLAARMKLFRER